MWLLTTDRAELHYFPRNFDAIGGYAILSHTWVGKEQTLQEVQVIIEQCHRNGTNPRDFVHPKIRECCIIAEKYGYRWVWIDSCCIDKTSSSELSEAINSMFRWYKEAEVCFAYLADVPIDCDLGADDSAFRKSRWHTRGWTLQELIAPEFLIFFSRDWRELGNRAELAGLVAEITGVPQQVLTGEDQPAHYSICIRMSWASKRNTTRVEDEAYCLMGLFKVRMPTNYGEGEQAFIRLQYEIMQHDPDMSLFAFGYRVYHDHSLTFHPKEEATSNWRYLMAGSPREFNSGFAYIPSLGTNADQQYPPPLDAEMTGPFEGGVELPRVTVTNYGVKLRVPIYEADGITIAILLCRWNDEYTGLFLTRDSWGKDPKRPRYFTSCVCTKPDTGSARYAARLTDLGNDLHNLTFSGKPVMASWRTIYVVPTPSDLESVSSTTPNLIMNCNPTSGFRVPRWLIARFTMLGYEVDQIRNTPTLQVVKIFHSREAQIFVSFGSCTENRHNDSNIDKPVQLWAKVGIVHFDNIDTFPHSCSEDHLDSQSWATRSKVFGDPERGIRFSLMPSTRKPDGELLVVHLELLGHVYEKMLQEAGVSSLFPTLAALERDIPRIAPNDPAPTSQPRTPLRIEPTSSLQSPPQPSSRIPHPVLQTTPNSWAQGRPEESDDDWPQLEQSRGSQRQGDDANLPQNVSGTRSRLESGGSREKVGMNTEGLADSSSQDDSDSGAIKDPDRQRRPGQRKKFSGMCKWWWEARRRGKVD